MAIIQQLNNMLLNAMFAFFINMVFNIGMDNKEQIKADRELLETLGGPTKVAELLGFDKAKGGVQRVQNWTTRGIPPKEKIAHSNILLPELSSAAHEFSASHLSQPPQIKPAPQPAFDRGK